MKKALNLLILTLFTTAVISAADKALIVGIENYKFESDCDKTYKNPGCVPPTLGGKDDALEMKKIAEKHFGFNPGSIKVLINSEATDQNIRDEFENWLIKGTNPGDRVFFFYSGHGARIPDKDGDEDDGKDEILAPFDVRTFPKPKNYIVDDEINLWLASLTNRRVVMVFDSCHSGTVSRSFNSKSPKTSKFLITETSETMRSADSGFSEIPKTMKARDLTVVVDKYMTNYTGNVVTISAAQAYQEALWIDANGNPCNSEPAQPKWRGALAYVFEKVMANSYPKVSDLKANLQREMTALAKECILCRGGNGEYQVPEVEYSASAGNLPLWYANGSDSNTSAAAAIPSWLESPIAALQNPLSKIKVDLKIDSQTNAYNIGDLIKYNVTVSEKVFLYVIVFSEDNLATCVFPSNNGGDTDNYVDAGIHRFPRRIEGKEAYEIFAQKPVGKDVWVAIASKRKLNLGEKEDYTWNEVFERVGIDKLRNALKEVATTRGVGTGLIKQSNDWQTAFAVMTTLEKESNR